MDDGDGKLRQLLRLKGCERPAVGFWEAFEGEFQSRRLGLLVREAPLARLCRRLRRALRPSVALLGTACAALLLTLAPGPRGAGSLPPSEFFSLALVRDVDEGVFIDDDFGDVVGDVCYVSELPIGRRPLLTACNF
jgi:hypothetical protein